MRGFFLFALALAPNVARAAEPATPAAPAAVAPVDAAAAQVEALRQRLLAAQQTIATLERQLATTKDRAVLADQCRIKNGRLVFISRELIEAYEKRWHQEHHDPLQLSRRKFEFELQALSDAVYDNRADVPIKVPGEKPAEPATDKSAGKKGAKPQSAAPSPVKPSGQ